MKSPCSFSALCFAGGLSIFAAEEPIDSRYRPIAPDGVIGDWQGASFVAQVSPADGGKYQAAIFRAFDVADDIDFVAPRFGSTGKKTANARGTVFLNGVKLYDQQELNPPKGAAGRLGEAPTGPIMLQEHGMPVQFRNIWVVEVR